MGRFEEDEEEERCVFLLQWRYYRGDVTWYKINPLKSTTSYEYLQPISCSDDDQQRSGSVTTTVGSPELYLFGGASVSISPGTKEATNDIFCCTSTSVCDDDQKIAWRKNSEQMVSSRSNPAVFSINQKIYIFGSKDYYFEEGEIRGVPDPWGEVFDTESGTCQPLKNPPKELQYCHHGLSAATVVKKGSKHMIFFNPEKSGNIFSYDVTLNDWNILEKHPLARGRAPFYQFKHALLSNVLYTYGSAYDSPKVYGFDLEKNEWFKGPVRGLFPDLEVPRLLPLDGFVQNLGNDKLFVAFSFSYTGRPGPLRERYRHKILCASFIPSIVEEESPEGMQRYVRAHVVSSGYYFVHGNYFVDSLPLMLQDKMKKRKIVNSGADKNKSFDLGDVEDGAQKVFEKLTEGCDAN